MKNYYLFIVLFVIQSFSQTIPSCGENQQEIIDKFNLVNNSASTIPSTYDANTKYVFNVRYHVVYNNDGITRTNSLGVLGLVIGENEVLESIKNLNLNFNQFNIYFKYYGMDQVNNSNYLIIETSNELNELILSDYSVSDAINIYIVNGSVVGASARVYAFDDNFFISPWTQCHEMGHYFSLAHTNHVTVNIPVGVPICQLKEHSTRISTDEEFNADIRGDELVDTHCYVNDSFFNSNCEYIGGATDCLGVQIQNAVLPNTNGYIISPQINNFMLADEANCTPVFTPGQGRRMREAIV